MEDLKQTYFDKGYCVVKDLLPKEMAAVAISEFHTLIKLQLEIHSNKSIYSGTDLYTDMQSLLAANPTAYLGALRGGAKLASVAQYLYHINNLNFIKDLGHGVPTVPAGPVLHIVGEKLRIPGGYNGFETHQDWPSIQGSLDCVIAWAPLLPVNEKNFPMQMIPKSHKRGLLPGDITENVYRVPDCEFSETDFVPTIADPGDVIFMSSWTLHRTAIKNCEGFRISTSIRWENAMEKTFIERGYPSAYKLSVSRELITSNFPTQAQVDAVFGDA